MVFSKSTTAVFSRVVRPLWRSLRVVEHLFTGAIIALAIVAGRRVGMRALWLPDLVRWWHARLCRALGVRVEVTGELAPNALLVANHVSWLDIPVMGSQRQMDFLAKSEVRDWPLIGWLAEIAGTLFIARGGNQTKSLIPHIGERVRMGGFVTIFPEGTTTDGSRLARFHPRLFGAGQLDGVIVQPIALRYGANSVPDQIAPFIGDDALLPHLARLVRHPDLRVRIQFLAPLEGAALSRREISDYCRRSIGESLGIETFIRVSPPAGPAVAAMPAPSSISLVEAA